MVPFSGKEHVLGEQIKIPFGHSECRMPVRHLSGDIKKAGGYMPVEPSEDLGGGMNVRGIRVSWN